jgi:hypothetical protein
MPMRTPTSRTEQDALRRQAEATGLDRAARRALRCAGQVVHPGKVGQPDPSPAEPGQASPGPSSVRERQGASVPTAASCGAVNRPSGLGAGGPDDLGGACPWRAAQPRSRLPHPGLAVHADMQAHDRAGDDADAEQDCA